MEYHYNSYNKNYNWVLLYFVYLLLRKLELFLEPDHLVRDTSDSGLRHNNLINNDQPRSAKTDKLGVVVVDGEVIIVQNPTW